MTSVSYRQSQGPKWKFLSSPSLCTLCKWWLDRKTCFEGDAFEMELVGVAKVLPWEANWKLLISTW